MTQRANVATRRAVSRRNFDIKGMVRRARSTVPFIFSEDVQRMNGAALAELEEAGRRTKKRNKYNAKGRRIDGVWFDSGLEADRYGELKLQAHAGVIKNLQVHVPFVLSLNGVRISKYEADFVYEQDGKKIVEDTKGKETELYKVNRALMLALFGIKIKEVRK